MMRGITDASTTRSPCDAAHLQLGVDDRGSSVPIRQVPTGW